MIDSYQRHAERDRGPGSIVNNRAENGEQRQNRVLKGVSY